MDKSTINIILAGCFLCGAAYLFRSDSVVVSPNVPTPVPTVPAGELETAVRNGDPETVRALGELYAAMGDTLSRAAPLSTDVLRGWLVSADTYMLQGTDLVGKVPGFGAAKDKLFTAALGLDSRQLTAAEMSSVAKLCFDVAGVCGVKRGS